EDIGKYLKWCSGKQPVKIICTYDSLKKVDFLLEKQDFRLIIDESDNILELTKGERKEAIFYMLKKAEEHKDKVSFISATPIPVEYMPQCISTISQIKMNWSNTITA